MFEALASANKFATQCKRLEPLVREQEGLLGSVLTLTNAPLPQHPSDTSITNGPSAVIPVRNDAPASESVFFKDSSEEEEESSDEESSDETNAQDAPPNSVDQLAGFEIKASRKRNSSKDERDCDNGSDNDSADDDGGDNVDGESNASHHSAEGTVVECFTDDDSGDNVDQEHDGATEPMDDDGKWYRHQGHTRAQLQDTWKFDMYDQQDRLLADLCCVKLYILSRGEVRLRGNYSSKYVRWVVVERDVATEANVADVTWLHDNVTKMSMDNTQIFVARRNDAPAVKGQFVSHAEWLQNSRRPRGRAPKNVEWVPVLSAYAAIGDRPIKRRRRGV